MKKELLQKMLTDKNLRNSLLSSAFVLTTVGVLGDPWL